MKYIKGLVAVSLFSWKNLDIGFEDKTSYSLVGMNGAGKSSIFEIITWILFKKHNKKNVRGDYGKTHGIGQLLLTDGENNWTISRDTKTPNQPRIQLNDENDKAIEQIHIEELIGCNYPMFMASVMCSQKRVAAFVNESTDSGKAKIFGEMLGCSILDEMRKKVSEVKSRKTAEYENLDGKVDAYREQMESALMSLGGDELEDVEAALESDKEELEEIREAEKKLRAKLKKVMAIEKEWDDWERFLEDKKKIGASIRKRQTDVRILQKNLKEAEEEEAQLAIKLKKYESNADIVTRKQSKLLGLQHVCQAEIASNEKFLQYGKECPTCGASITLSRKKSITRKTQLLYDELNSRREEVSGLAKRLKSWVDKAEAVKKRMNRSSKILSEIERIEYSISESNKNLAYVTSGREAPKEPRKGYSVLNSDIDAKAAKRFNLEKAIAKRATAVKTLRTAKKRLEEVEEKARKKGNVVEVYEWLFKHIPLMKLRYIHNNKVALEDSINGYLGEMSVPFIVKIDTHKILKSTKEVKEAFSFQIVSTTRDRKADRKDLSGGEETCILLATQFGINDMSSVDLGFEIYDEVYGSLDSKNVPAVVNALKMRGELKQIFTISHNPEISHSFDKVVKVVNRKGYSQIAS
jgi:DNA repair exonuclease SbcCD ATPase subunit